MNPLLERYFERVWTKPSRVLVPLCGKAHDLQWLAERESPPAVVGVEFVDEAAAAFFAERSIVPERRGRIRSAHGVDIVSGDFFSVEPPEVGGVFDAIYDRAAMVALPPEMRGAYVQHLRSLAGPGARVLLITFVHNLGGGPPFSIEADEVHRRYEGAHVELLEDTDILEGSSFATRGATVAREQAWSIRL